jgi:hypothetical protein
MVLIAPGLAASSRIHHICRVAERSELSRSEWLRAEFLTPFHVGIG